MIDQRDPLGPPEPDEDEQTECLACGRSRCDCDQRYEDSRERDD